MESETPAIAAARTAGIAFDVVRTDPPSTAEESAALQGVELGRLLRSIVVRRGSDDYIFVLVPAGRQIDWPKLRSHLGVKRLSLPDRDEARDATGYERGAITPLGSVRPWPVLLDASAADLDRVAIGGGARGVNLHLSADALVRALSAAVADVGRPDQGRRDERSSGS
jgi:Cys-tRNA(Pro) deacylase